jgi:branched-chain amino acid transport system permease protein
VSDPPPASRNRARGKTAGWALLVILMAGFPFAITNPTYTSIGVFTVLLMAATTAWNMFSGFSGYISLGHAVFYGVGAYTLALLANHLGMAGGYGIFALVPVAGIVAALVAIPFGMITLRTRRRTFIVITIAIFWLFQLSAYNFSFTGGAAGLQLPTPTWSGSSYNLPFYVASFVLFGIAITLAWVVRHSRFGLQLLAIRDDEDRASALGVRVWPIKMTALVLSALVSGMVGALWVYFLGQVFPQFAFDPLFAIGVTLMAFFGGIGTLAGPVIGALVLESTQQYLDLQFSNGSIYLVVFGALFLVVLLFMPKGIVPALASWLAAWRQRRVNRAGDSSDVPSGEMTAVR